MDLYVANMFSSAGDRIAFQEKFQTGASDSITNLFRFDRKPLGFFLFGQFARRDIETV